jgi:hypothetical protein
MCTPAHVLMRFCHRFDRSFAYKANEGHHIRIMHVRIQYIYIIDFMNGVFTWRSTIEQSCCLIIMIIIIITIIIIIIIILKEDWMIGSNMSMLHNINWIFLPNDSLHDAMNLLYVQGYVTEYQVTICLKIYKLIVISVSVWSN